MTLLEIIDKRIEEQEKFDRASKLEKEKLLAQEALVQLERMFGPEAIVELHFESEQEWFIGISSKEEDGSLYWVDSNFRLIAQCPAGHTKRLRFNSIFEFKNRLQTLKFLETGDEKYGECSHCNLIKRNKMIQEQRTLNDELWALKSKSWISRFTLRKQIETITSRWNDLQKEIKEIRVGF